VPVQGENSKTVEDYLLTIYTMTSEGHPVIAARLAEAMKVAPPTVTATLQRMSNHGLISLGQHKEVELTESGYAQAETMVRRHRLAERLLVDLLGLDWADVHEEAHRFEHAISPRVEERILAVLGSPKTCPHGSPIPGTGAVAAADAVLLDQTGTGDQVIIERISEDAENDRDLLNYFQRFGLLPGREFVVSDVEPHNALVILRSNGNSIPVGFQVARKIWVRKTPAAVS
jgi:DtxR family Mn-dependent transcriptional regulator